MVHEGELRKLILGIDPGTQGSAALFDPEIKSIVSVWDFPTFEINGKTQVDVVTLAKQIENHAPEIALAVIEAVGAAPGQGVSSMFSFGKACGQIHGILAANEIPTHFVRPSVWKATFGLGPDKDESRKRVIGLFPKEAHHFKLKKDHNKAEAVLLAIFGCRL